MNFQWKEKLGINEEGEGNQWCVWIPAAMDGTSSLTCHKQEMAFHFNL